MGRYWTRWVSIEWEVTFPKHCALKPDGLLFCFLLEQSPGVLEDLTFHLPGSTAVLAALDDNDVLYLVIPLQVAALRSLQLSSTFSLPMTYVPEYVVAVLQKSTQQKQGS